MQRNTVSVERAAEGYLEAFRFNDVDYFFTSPGSDDVQFWKYLAEFATEDKRPGYVSVRHEQTAVDMARGYAMMTGRPQVVKVHVTVGAYNAALGIWGAHQGSNPVVILSSYPSTYEGEQPGGAVGPYYLDFDMPGGVEHSFERFTKLVGNPRTNDNVGEYFARAFRVAASVPQGPVFLNLATELPYESLEEFEIVRGQPAEPPTPSDATLDRIVERVEAAENPLLVVGGRLDPPAVDALITLSEQLEIPVFETPKESFNFPIDHPLYLGASGEGLAHPVDPYLEYDVDLVLALGTSVPWFPPVSAAPDADLILLHPEPSQLKRAYWSFQTDILATGDASATLPGLVDRVTASVDSRPTDWRGLHDTWQETWSSRVQAGAEDQPVDPFWLTQVLEEKLTDDAIIVNETLDHHTCIVNLISAGENRHFINSERLNAGGLGSGLALGLGAKLAAPDRLVAVLIGDGAFNYNPIPAAFGASQRYDLPLLVILYDNRGYQVMSIPYLRDYPDETDVMEHFGAALRPTPDYETMVEAWEAEGATVDAPEGLEPALDASIDAVEQGRTALVDVKLPQRAIEYPTIE